MNRATILNVAEINELMSAYEGKDCTEFIRKTLVMPEIYWFLSDTEESVMVFMPMDNYRYDMHIYNKAKGDKKLIDWCITVGTHMLEETPAMTLINFVKEDRRDLRMFMASIGCKKVAKIRDEIMYVTEYEDKERIKNRRNI